MSAPSNRASSCRDIVRIVLPVPIQCDEDRGFRLAETEKQSRRLPLIFLQMENAAGGPVPRNFVQLSAGLVAASIIDQDNLTVGQSAFQKAAQFTQTTPTFRSSLKNGTTTANDGSLVMKLIRPKYPAPPAQSKSRRTTIAPHWEGSTEKETEQIARCGVDGCMRKIAICCFPSP